MVGFDHLSLSNSLGGSDSDSDSDDASWRCVGLRVTRIGDNFFIFSIGADVDDSNDDVDCCSRSDRELRECCSSTVIGVNDLHDNSCLSSTSSSIVKFNTGGGEEDDARG